MATDGSIQDRGLQIGWTTVFLAEYAGPLLVNIFSEHFLNLNIFSSIFSSLNNLSFPQTYLWFTQRPWLAYGDLAEGAGPLGLTQQIACAAW